MGDFAKANAAALELALATGRRQLGGLEDGDERTRREQALALIEQYAALLRDAPPALCAPMRYCFKLVFPDGRWSVDELQLDEPPQAGDVIGVSGARWRIEGSQHVGVRPSGKPARHVFVCAPTA